jgi:hypothetical protein
MLRTFLRMGLVFVAACAGGQSPGFVVAPVAPAGDSGAGADAGVGGDANAGGDANSGANAGTAVDSGAGANAGTGASTGTRTGVDANANAGAVSAPARFRSCSNDSDCIAVPRVGCCHNGWKEAVAVSQKDAYAASFVCPDAHPICAMILVRDTRVPRCEPSSHLCELIGGAARIPPP